MTKKNYGLYMKWKNATMRSIYDAYVQPSSRKVSAFEWYENKCAELDGWDLRIPNKNTFGFTLAFLFKDAEDGKVKMWYATMYDDYVFPLEFKEDQIE